MIKRFNQATHSFIIETKTKGGQHLCYWRIDQSVIGPDEDEALQRVENQVVRHINSLATRTGLVFWVTLSGTVDTIDTIVKNSGYEIS